MRILIATDTYFPHVNGASYFTQRLVRYLAKRGNKVFVIAPSKTVGFTKEEIEEVTVFGIPSLPVFFYKGFRVVYPIGVKKHVDNILKSIQPDIVHAQSHFTLSRAVISQAKNNNIPIVATNHFMPENLVHYFHLPSFFEKTIVYFAWKDCIRVFSKADVVTSQTKSAAQLLKSQGFLHNMPLISCGIDISRFTPKNRKKTIPDKFRFSSAPTLIFVGRLDKEKNLDVVLHAIARVPKKIAFTFVIVGAGAEKKYLQKLVIDLGIAEKVRFLGFVPDIYLPLLYARSDCFITAGTAELQSIATMEAMASGLPIIAASAVALPELVNHTVSGFLFSVKDIQSLARYIETLITNKELRAKMGKESLKIIANHDIIKTIDAFESLYASAIKKSKLV